MTINRDSLTTKIFHYLKEEILSGRIQNGEKILEEPLAKQFGISKSPIREAMLRLREYGLLIITPRQPARVIKFTAKDTEDFNDLRYCLESHALDLLTPEKLKKYETFLGSAILECEKSANENNRALSFEKDAAFHIALFKATENTALLDTYNHIEAKIQLLRMTQYINPDDLRYHIMQHREMIRLLKEQKMEDCKKILHNHIIH